MVLDVFLGIFNPFFENRLFLSFACCMLLRLALFSEIDCISLFYLQFKNNLSVASVNKNVDFVHLVYIRLKLVIAFDHMHKTAF